jgi:hypothetical protein
VNFVVCATWHSCRTCFNSSVIIPVPVRLQISEGISKKTNAIIEGLAQVSIKQGKQHRMNNEFTTPKQEKCRRLLERHEELTRHVHQASVAARIEKQQRNVL